MSRTDKTDPYWVKLNRYGVESHDHRYDVCDIGPATPYHGRYHHRCGCFLDQPERAYCDNGWLPRPKEVKEYAAYRERSERRKVKRQLASGDWDNISPYRTRSTALWDMW